MTCVACNLEKEANLGGLYCFTCVRCCARLIRSARPLRGAQEAMFAAIERLQGAPSKGDVIAAIKVLDSEA